MCRPFWYEIDKIEIKAKIESAANTQSTGLSNAAIQQWSKNVSIKKK